MDRLHKTLVHHLRSFLPTNEIFQSASVCKSWEDISNIPKSISVSYSRVPPYVDLSKTYHLDIRQHYDKEEVLSLIRRCAQNLRILELTCDARYPTAPTENIPYLPKVTDFNLNFPNPSNTLNTMLRQMPNLENFRLQNGSADEYAIPNLDFSSIPKLRELYFWGRIMTFSNSGSVNLQKITLDLGLKYEEQLNSTSNMFQDNPNAKVTFLVDNFKETD